MAEEYLRQVYDLTSQEAIDDYYARWATTYDEELIRNGYRSPSRCAEALARFVPLDAPILDIGCGTGISGRALAAAGFTEVSGQDPNSEMLAVAEQAGIYRQVRVNDVTDPYPFTPGTFAAITAVGVIGVGAGPSSLLTESMDALAPAGCFALSFNDHALEDPEMCAAMNDLLASAHVEQLFCEHGPHIEQLGTGANVYVLRRI